MDDRLLRIAHSTVADQPGQGTAPAPETLDAFLDQLAQSFGPRPAVLQKPGYRTEVWSYRDLWDRSNRVARWLREQGVQKGDRVLLWAPNGPWWVAALFGTVRLGAILVPLDVRSNPEFIHRIVSQTEPRLALVSRAVGQRSDFPVPRRDLEDLLALSDAGVDLREPDLRPDDVAEVIFTSGTTGDPKGVVLTHRNILANVEAVNRVFPSRPQFRLLSILPLSHMFEQTVGLLLPLRGGASVYYPTSRKSTMLFRDLREQRITTILLVPQALQLFMAAIEREVARRGQEMTWHRLLKLAEHLPLSLRRVLFRPVHQRLGGSLQLLVSGGAPLEPELIRRWELLGIPVLQGYGTTEASPVITATSVSDRNPHSVGKAVPGVELTIAPDGEVLVRGPSITRGYWRSPQATQAAFSAGWYGTGDLGHLDDKGYLYLRGRKKDLIVLANGQNVYPEDVERVLKQLPGVADAVVVALPGTQGPEVHAVLIGESRTVDMCSVVGQANARLAFHQQIRGFTIWPDADFPRTHTLKVKKQEVLRALLDEPRRERQRSASPSRVADGTPPLRRIVSELAGVPPTRLHADATLGEDLGLDSLGRVELLAAIEGELGVYLDEAQIDARTTLAQLEILVDRQQSDVRRELPTWPTSGFATFVRRIVQLPIFALLDPVTPTEVRGRELLEGLAPPVLFAANHTSHLDSPTVVRVLPREWRRVAVAAATDYFFAWPLLGFGAALALNAFPFSRATGVRSTLEHCARLLDRGWSILLFPEGTRSTTGQIGPFRPGVGLLAVELQVPVVPVHIDGLFEVLPKGSKRPRPGRVTVSFGRPLRFPVGTSSSAAASRIEAAVRSLRRDGPRPTLGDDSMLRTPSGIS